MKHVTNGLMTFAVNHLSRNKLIHLVTQVHLKPEHFIEMYMEAWENGLYDKMEDLSGTPTIKKYFRYLGPLYDKFVLEKKMHLLPLPAFRPTIDFESQVRNLTGKQYRKGFLKSFGKKTEEYGVTFLNNIYFLNRIYRGLEINYDKLFNLDHSKVITRKTMECMEGLTFIRDHYQLERIFNLITLNEHEVEEVHIIISGTPIDNNVFKDALPRKPKSFKELHDIFSDIVINAKATNYQLNQDISYLHGMSLYEFEIEVPAESKELRETSKDLNHCVGTYDARIIKKQCQIVNLLKDKKRIYTIELVPMETGRYFIRQFRGKNNDKTMESNEGSRLRDKLLELITQHQEIV